MDTAQFHDFLDAAVNEKKILTLCRAPQNCTVGNEISKGCDHMDWIDYHVSDVNGFLLSAPLVH